MSMFRVMGQLGLDGAHFFGTLGRAQTAMNRFGRSIASSIGGRLAAAFSVGAITMFARSTIDLARSLVDMSNRTGVSVESLQRLNRAAQDNGASIENLVSFWEKLAMAREKALRDPTGSEAKAFAGFGVSRNDLQTKSAEELTRKISLAFQTDTNVQELIAPLREIGGKGAGAMVAIFRTGLDQMYQDIAVMSTETATALDDLDDAFTQLQITIKTMFAPVLVGLMNFINGGIMGIKAWNMALKSAFDFLRGGGNIKGAFDAFGESFIDAAGDAIIDDVATRARKRQTEPKALDFSDITPEKKEVSGKKASGNAPYSDALVSIGNFLGTNQASVGRVAERQLEVLHRIERNTRRSGFATSTWGDPSGFATTSFDAE